MNVLDTVMNVLDTVAKPGAGPGCVGLRCCSRGGLTVAVRKDVGQPAAARGFTNGPCDHRQTETEREKGPERDRGSGAGGWRGCDGGSEKIQKWKLLGQGSHFLWLQQCVTYHVK